MAGETYNLKRLVGPLDVVAICALVWISLPREPLLLELSSPVLPRERFHWNTYAWLSNDELIGARKDRLIRYHIRPESAMDLTGLVEDKSTATDLYASPDGKWLLWLASKPDTRAPDIRVIDPCIARLASGPVRKKPYAWNEIWEPDSQHTVGFTNPSGMRLTTAVVYDARSGRTSRTIPVGADVVSRFTSCVATAPDRLLEVEDTASGPYVGPISEATTNQTTDISEYRLDTTLHRVRTWSVDLPMHTTVAEARISPTGDRIAWILNGERINPTDILLHRLFTSFNIITHHTQELWVSAIDGSGLREIGHSPPNPGPDAPGDINDLRWLPDRRALSYLYNDRLYRIAVW
jgi:hypothetical protein